MPQVDSCTQSFGFLLNKTLNGVQVGTNSGLSQS